MLIRLFSLFLGLGAALFALGCASQPPVVSGQTLGPYNYAPALNSARTSYTVTRPPGNDPRPAVLIIHGGGWTRGEPADMDPYVARVVAAGWVAINLSYRFAPEHLWPAQREDLRAAMLDIHARRDELGVDSQRIAVLGYSAGAHLAAVAAVDPNPRAPRPVALVAGAGPFDLTKYLDSRLVSTFLGGIPAAVGMTTYRDASPHHKITTGAPPTYLWHGTWDALVSIDQSRAFAKELEKAGVPVTLRERFGRGHLTNFLLDDEDWEEIRAFLAAYLNPPTVAENRQRISR